MKIFITETDRQNARSVALRNLARFFDIENWELKKPDELLKELSSLNTEPALSLIKLLNTYFDAYNEWYEFYDQKKKVEQQTGEEYNLNTREILQLEKLIRNREDSLNALQQKFDELQVQKFNRDNFGSDIIGIID
jgi:hypothetical protein